MSSTAEFFDDVALEGTFHDAIGEIAIFQARPARSSPVCAPLDASVGIEHREPVVVLAGKREHLEAGLLEKLHPLLSIELGGIELLVELLIFLPLLIGITEQRPRLPGLPQRINAPMNAHAELHVTESVTGGFGGLMIVRVGGVFDVCLYDLIMRVAGRQPHECTGNARGGVRRRQGIITSYHQRRHCGPRQGYFAGHNFMGV